jgi:hypothetical protein
MRATLFSNKPDKFFEGTPVVRLPQAEMTRIDGAGAALRAKEIFQYHSSSDPAWSNAQDAGQLQHWVAQ